MNPGRAGLKSGLYISEEQGTGLPGRNRDAENAKDRPLHKRRAAGLGPSAPLRIKGGRYNDQREGTIFRLLPGICDIVPLHKEKPRCRPKGTALQREKANSTAKNGCATKS